ncbi:hypothetical protein DSL72_006516 [Monilinia vaccinii-corymbosi]|uniref:Glucose-methanol-choline oxidoreductase N-terminal domain-containing protein n=1 Tax=Monilinia vaccinii-corymbosi TaxID=61207 RepID=A0A8A3PNY9_9HELO|nr:hypothetical protein DSL72_006516 [Monilinia vaccinii-corymbosi]
MVNFSNKQLLLLASLSLTAQAVPNSNHKQQSKYDMIVVGGGAGGLVTSTKFAEAGLKTLLLEHGGPMLYVDGNREIPEWSTKQYPGNNLTLHDTMMLYFFNYPGTGPNASSYYCKNVKNLAACMLGGGTSVNAAQQWWPPKKYLENTYNLTGWTGDVFQEAIKRVAHRIPPTPTWSIDNKHYYDEVYHLMGSVLKSIGISEVDTITDVEEKYDNFGRDVFAAKGGQRGGPLVGYLQDAKKLPNFTLMMNSPVTRVIRHGPHIKGVEVNGTVIYAKAVVLSAGTWNTPSILFASGIGPKSELATAKKIGFTKYAEKEWIINDGVGANLHDNPQTTITLQYSNSSALPSYNMFGALAGNVSKADADDLYLRRTGPLASPGRELSGWIKVPYPHDASKYMVVQTICSRPTTVDGNFNCQFCLNEGALSRGRVALGQDGGMTFAEGEGRGPWLTNPLDTELYATAMKRFIDGANAYPGLTVTSPAGTHDVPYYVSYLNKTARASNNHWGGSCSLGLCVDEDTLVHGTQNLYVIDGSLSPAPTTSNPSFLYESIAELASDRVIKKLSASR